MQPNIVHGQCLCGAVKFTAALPSKWVAHCHCTLCQRAHGAALVTWVGMESDKVRIPAGDGEVKWFASPAGGERAFCTHCGSSMFFRSSQWPGELHVARALFTEPIDRDPQAHVYYDTHVPWVAFADDLPRKPAPEASASGAAVTTLIPMSPEAFAVFLPVAIESYAQQNVASGRWSAESAMERSRAEHGRLLPQGLATKDAHLFEILDSKIDASVGTLWLAVQRAAERPRGYVFNVHVKDEHRRKGHAKSALQTLESIGRDLGLASIDLNVFAFNIAARRLYEELGYEATAFTMRKSL